METDLKNAVFFLILKKKVTIGVSDILSFWFPVSRKWYWQELLCLKHFLSLERSVSEQKAREALKRAHTGTALGLPVEPEVWWLIISAAFPKRVWHSWAWVLWSGEHFALMTCTKYRLFCVSAAHQLSCSYCKLSCLVFSLFYSITLMHVYN